MWKFKVIEEKDRFTRKKGFFLNVFNENNGVSWKYNTKYYKFKIKRIKRFTTSLYNIKILDKQNNLIKIINCQRV